MYSVHNGHSVTLETDSYNEAITEFVKQVRVGFPNPVTEAPTPRDVETIKNVVDSFIKTSHKFQWGNVSITFKEKA